MKQRNNYTVGSFEQSQIQQTMEAKTSDGQTLVISRWRPYPVGKSKKIPIILLPGLGQNRYTWHLSRISMVNYLVDRGMDVFVPEFRGHGLSRLAGSKAPKGFSDYVFKDMSAIFKTVMEKTGYDKIFLCGHSLGGTIAYAIDPSLDKHVRGYIFIGSPSHFGRGLLLLRLGSQFVDKTLNSMVSRKQREKAGESDPIPFPIDFIGRGIRTGLKILNSPVNFLPYKLWYPGSIEQGDLKERITMGFDRTSTAVVKLMVIWASRGAFVDEEGSDLFERNLRAKKAPALFIAGDRDEVVPDSSMRPAFHIISSTDKTWKNFNMKEHGAHWGHIDLVVGKHAPREVWPYIADWCQER